MQSKGINLGRCWNKYLIIDIFFYAAEDDARKEAEAVLWLCSRGHRQFLHRNFEWYARNIDWKLVWYILKDHSGQLKSMEQAKFLFEHIRIDGKTEVKKIIPIFRATRDGWDYKDFHRLCDNRGPTLCLMQAEGDYISAGFTSIAWASPESATDVEDASACVFALTDTLQVYKTNNPEKAVRHNSCFGPRW